MSSRTSNVILEQRASALFAQIQTDNLTIQSCQQEDLVNYSNLFKSSVLAHRFESKEVFDIPVNSNGKFSLFPKKMVFDPSKLEERMNNVWLKNWQFRDPYGMFSIFTKKRGDFFGYINISRNQEKINLELMFNQKNLWTTNLEVEAISGLVAGYIPNAVRNLSSNPIPTTIEITTKTTSDVLNKILNKTGLFEKSTEGSSNIYSRPIFEPGTERILNEELNEELEYDKISEEDFEIINYLEIT
jgi:hypothetical protein